MTVQMQGSGFYRIYNIETRLACGYRFVFAEVRRKLVSILDWATGEHVTVTRSDFERMSPRQEAPPMIKLLKAGKKRATGSHAMFSRAITTARAVR